MPIKPAIASALAALPRRFAGAVALAAALGLLLALAGPWLRVGSGRPLEPLATRWALMLLLCWALVLWAMRRSLLGPLLGLLALLVAGAGPQLAWGDARPLQPVAARAAVVVTLLLGYLAWLGWKAWTRQGREQDLRQLAAALRRLLLPSAPERRHVPAAVAQAAAAQRQWMQLHAGNGWGGRLQAWRAGSALPWYLVLGAAGSGKSSLLTASSLRLLRCEGAAFEQPDPLACAWWVGERAMFVEVSAGPRDTPQAARDADVDAGSPQASPESIEPASASATPGADESWGELMDALRRRRGDLPLHGVVLTLDCAVLARGTAEQRGASAALVRRRLLQLQGALGTQLPAYLVMSKADALTGFDEFFRAADSRVRGGLGEASWGFTLPWRDSRTAQAPQAPQLRGQLRDEFGLLCQGLRELLPACLQQEPLLSRRCRMFEFPHAHAELAARVQEWLETVFAQWPGSAPDARRRALGPGPRRPGQPPGLALRGVFFASCANGRDAAAAQSGTARFAACLLRDSLLADCVLARPDDPRLRRRRQRSAVVGCALLLGVCAALYAMHGSYMRAQHRLGALQRNALRLQQQVQDAVQSGPPPAAPWQGALQAARQYADAARLAEQSGSLAPFGARVLQPVRDAADSVLLGMQQALLLPALVRSMREQLEQDMQHERMGGVIDTLSVYLMLHEPGRYDAERLRAWAAAHDAGQETTRALEHPVGVLQDRSALDDALVRRVRDWLLRWPRGQRLWHLARTRAPATQEPADFSLAALQAGQPRRSFERASGRAADDGVAGWYGERAWNALLRARLPELAERAAAEDAWLVGEAPPSASADALAEELRHAYWLEYARQWMAFLGDIRPVPMPGLEQQLQLLRAMAAQDSPLLDLVRRVWNELKPLQTSETAQDDPVAQGLLALRAFSGSDPDGQALHGLRQALDAYATAASLQATEISAGQAGSDALAQARARLIAQAGSLPAPVGNVVTALADDTAQRVLGAGSGLARKQAEQEFARIAGAFQEQVAAVCARGLAGHFPLSRGGADANIDDFAGFFGPGGSAQRYFDAYLKPWVDVSRRPWRYRAAPATGGDGVAPPPNGDALSAQAAQELLRMLARAGPDPDAFARIARIRSALWRHDGAAPGWGFDVSVPSMDPGLTMLRLQVDGQAMRYAHGPVQAWPARWPGPRPATGASLRLEPGDGAAPIEYSAQGPWAWMHVLAHGRRRPASAGDGVDVEFGAPGRGVVLHVGGAEPNPWRPGVLEGFSCPR